MENTTPERGAGEHSLHKRLEFYITMVERCRDRATKSNLVCLEAIIQSVCH